MGAQTVHHGTLINTKKVPTNSAQLPTVKVRQYAEKCCIWVAFKWSKVFASRNWRCSSQCKRRNFQTTILLGFNLWGGEWCQEEPLGNSVRSLAPQVNAAFLRKSVRNMDAAKSCIQPAERRKETTFHICSSPTQCELRKKETTLSFACVRQWLILPWKSAEWSACWDLKFHNFVFPGHVSFFSFCHDWCDAKLGQTPGTLVLSREVNSW